MGGASTEQKQQCPPGSSVGSKGGTRRVLERNKGRVRRLLGDAARVLTSELVCAEAPYCNTGCGRPAL